MKELQKILRVPGMLTQNEVEYLYRLGQLNSGKGVIVEIGSWKGKSTISLAWGSMAGAGEEVYAVDPHKPLAEEGYLEDTEAEFRKNIKEAGVEARVVPLVMTSKEAADGWHRPIRLLWIDGDHRYEQVKRDFLLWEPHVIDGGSSPCMIRSASRDRSRCCGRASFALTVSSKYPLWIISRPLKRLGEPLC